MDYLNIFPGINGHIYIGISTEHHIVRNNATCQILEYCDERKSYNRELNTARLMEEFCCALSFKISIFRALQKRMKHLLLQENKILKKFFPTGVSHAEALK